MKFNIGDTVKVLFSMIHDDDKYVGKELKVIEMEMCGGDEFYVLEGMSEEESMILKQLELVSEKSRYPKTVIIGDTKIIWNPPYTILFENWNTDEQVKSITKCLDGDTFHERDGYMFALAKMLMPEDIKAYFREQFVI